MSAVGWSEAGERRSLKLSPQWGLDPHKGTRGLQTPERKAADKLRQVWDSTTLNAASEIAFLYLDRLLSDLGSLEKLYEAFLTQ